jgi:hypothetical protein
VLNYRMEKRAAKLVLLAIIGLALSACSSASTPSTTTTTLPSVASSTAAIKHAYGVLFDLADPALSPKLAVIQDGSALSSAMKTALSSNLAKAAGGASVSAVTIEHGSACKNEFLPSPCAKVTYDILSPKKTVLLPDSGGLAIYEKAKWVVAKVTICTLLELEAGGTVPPGCSG